MHQVYRELGELIKAIGTPWFDSTLPAVIQCVFDYDYFLLARYEENQPLQIERSDFQGVEMQQTLHHLVTQTHVAEPIFRLFNAGKTSAGIYDMRELVCQSHALPEPLNLSSPHMIVDDNEEIGWRTIGWPEYQQETCILIPIDDSQLIAVSLFNFGLTAAEPTDNDQLKSIYPAVSSAILRHFQLQPKITKANKAHPNSTNTDQDIETTIRKKDIARFLEANFGVSITARETEIFTPLLQGKTLSAIADKLGISINTARTHRRNVYRKIGHGRLLELINQFHTHMAQADRM